MCCNAHHRSLLKDKVNIQTHKTTVGCTWHQIHLEKCGPGDTVHPQSTEKYSPSMGDLMALYSAVQKLFSLLLHLPGESSGSR